MNSLSNVVPNCGNSGLKPPARPGDCRFDFVGAKDGFSVHKRAVLLNLVVEVFIMNGNIKVFKFGNILYDFLKVVDEPIILEEGDGAEAIVEVGEHIGD